MRLRRPAPATLLAAVVLLAGWCLPAAAPAMMGGYASHVWAGCSGGYNSGSWDDAGRLYVPCGSPSTVGVYATDGSLVESITLDRFVSDVAPTRDGRYLYLAGPGGPSRLVRSDAGTWVPDAWSPAAYSLWGSQFRPGGHFVATDAAGNVYYADGAWAPNSTHTVLKYAPDGRLVTRFGEWARSWQLGTFYWALGGLAVSDDGAAVYTVELGNNRVQHWARQASGAYAVAGSFGGSGENNADRGGYCDYRGWIGAFAAPYDVALDRAGNLYVINTTCKQVLKFAPGTRELLANLDVRVDGGDYPRPHGFAVGAGGEIYVGENQRALRPAGGALPTSGAPPGQVVQPTPPAPTSPTAAAPADQPAAASATQPASTGASSGSADTAGGGPVADRSAPRIGLTARPRAVVTRRGAFVQFTARCAERCRIDAVAMRRGRPVGRRVIWLAPHRATLIVVPLGRSGASSANLAVRIAARDVAGNTATQTRLVSGGPSRSQRGA